jgi:hypothetical protein
MDYENMNILQIRRELNTPDKSIERIDPAALKREIFFHNYAPLVIDETSNAIVFEIFRIIDAAPRLEPEDLAVTYNEAFLSGYLRAYEEIQEAAKKKIKEAGSNENE